MITINSQYGGSPLVVDAIVRGIAVYLDNFAIGGLAEGKAARRDKFVSSLHSGADILFSVANVSELVGPQGKSLEAVKNLLAEIGPHWCPFELDPVGAITVEGRFFRSSRDSSGLQGFIKSFCRRPDVRLPGNRGSISRILQFEFHD